MHQIEKIPKKISDVVDKSYTVVGIVFLIALTAATFVQVIGRSVFNNSPSWTDELARYSFVWANMLGVAIALKHGKHAAVDLLETKLNGTAKAIQKLVVDGLITFAGTLLLVEGCKMTAAIYATGQLSPAMRIPMWMIYLSTAFSGFGMLIHCILFLIEDVLAFRGEGEQL